MSRLRCLACRLMISTARLEKAVPGFLRLQDPSGICDRRQRVAQLVTQHRDELVLRTVRRLGFRAGRLLALKQL